MRNQVMLNDSNQLVVLNSLILLSNYGIPNQYQRRCEVFVPAGLTTQWVGIETDAGCYAQHAHALHTCTHKNTDTLCTSHWYTPSIINKYATHIIQKHKRLPTVSPPIRHQRVVLGFPARAFHLVKWVSLRHTFLPSPSISKQPFVPIADYPSYLEAISLAD